MLFFRRAAGIALVVCGIAACQEREIVAPSADQIVVQALLDVDSREQTVLVERTLGTLSGQRPVAGAIVTLTAPDGRVLTARESIDSVLYTTPPWGSPPIKVPVGYRINLDEYGVTLSAGETYHLRIVTPSGQTVTGSTVIPVTSRLASLPLTLDTVRAGATFRVAWEPAPAARTFELRVTTTAPSFTAFLDSTKTLSAPSQLASFTDLGVASLFSGYLNTVIVLAVDRNYYDFYRRSGASFVTEPPISHLSGGIGVFGSIGQVGRHALRVR
jgi:hypothetical protein